MKFVSGGFTARSHNNLREDTTLIKGAPYTKVD